VADLKSDGRLQAMVMKTKRMGMIKTPFLAGGTGLRFFIPLPDVNIIGKSLAFMIIVYPGKKPDIYQFDDSSMYKKDYRRG
jgi:hypothetical protein